MEFILLGSGTSTGVPVPGCRCRVCTSQHPRNYRNRTSALIRTSTGKGLLIDATPDLRQQALIHDIRSVDAVFFTHYHADHILGTDDLRSFNFVHHQRISCFGTKPTLDVLRDTFRYIFDPVPGYKGGLLAQLDLCEMDGCSEISILDIPLRTFPLEHGDVTVTGFRVGNVGYATDCKTLSPQAVEILQGVEYLFLDGLRYEQHFTHMSIPEAVAAAQGLGAKTTYLIHTTHTVDYEEVNAALPEGIKLGYDGLSVPITLSDPTSPTASTSL
jgi:phosphoribosyl 1,2-cyclic phosphate phosphodiesterase